jgi:hypothetical protein
MESRKVATEARVVFHGLEHSQYFQGHGTAFTRFADCATGIGSTEQEALNDALEQLASNGWDTEALEKLEDVEEDVKRASGEVPKDLREAWVECGEDGECELYVYVSVDVK